MARLFDDGSLESLSIAQAVASGTPMSMAAWVRSDEGAADQYVIQIADSGSADNYFGINLDTNAGAPTRVRAVINDGTFDFAETTANWSTNTWHHVTAVFANATSRAAYLDGGNKGTDASSRSPAGLDTTIIGYSADSTPVDPFSGRIAEVGVWNVALTDADVAQLAAGYSPLFVRPESLVAYYSLIRDEDQDRVGGYDLTPNNTPSIAAHPAVYYPCAQSIVRQG